MRLIKVIFTTIVVVFSSVLYAEDDTVDTCKKIVVAGEPKWAPYTVIGDDEHIYGIGMELIEMVISELDIPIEKKTFIDERKMLHSLSMGQTDLLVSTYKTDRIALAAEIIHPGYINDPVTVAVNKRNVGNLHAWDDLMGRRGAMARELRLEDGIGTQLYKLLHINRYEDFESILAGIRDNSITFALGSGLQLIYEIDKNGLTKDIKIARELSKGSNVHMAFSKRSACSAYIPYIQKRLIEARKDGTVTRIVNKYIPR